MAETFALKDYYGTELARLLASKIKEQHPLFNSAAFINYVSGRVEPLELKARITVITEGLRKYLPADYKEAIAILISILGPPNPSDEGMFKYGYYLMPAGEFVRMYGLDDFETSMRAIYEITQRNTSEFAIRPFIERYPQKVLKLFKKWAKDKSAHVRRLVSEGTRPRLPWAMKLDIFKDNPAPVIELLELLKEDTSAFVSKSVANHLSDIAKHDKRLVLDLLKTWGASGNKYTADIIRHALRNLVKEGDKEALALLGYPHEHSMEVKNLEVKPGRLSIGDSLIFNFTLVNTGKAPQTAIVDYVIYYVKSKGLLSKKVFKLCEKSLSAGGKTAISKKHNFKDLTTRKHFPGKHAIEIQVNGVKLAKKEFMLI